MDRHNALREMLPDVYAFTCALRDAGLSPRFPRVRAKMMPGEDLIEFAARAVTMNELINQGRGE